MILSIADSWQEIATFALAILIVIPRELNAAQEKVSAMMTIEKLIEYQNALGICDISIYYPFIILGTAARLNSHPQGCYDLRSLRHKGYVAIPRRCVC